MLLVFIKICDDFNYYLYNKTTKINIYMNIPDFETWSTKMQGETYLKKHFPEFLQILNNLYPNIQTIREKIYLYRNRLKEPGRCVVCGNYTKYDGPSKGYRIYCSSKCCNNDNDKKNKTKFKMMEKYGVENPSQINEVKEKKKETCLKNYGVENPSQINEVKEKIKQTCLERYGVEYSLQSKEIQEKIKQTCLERYGEKYAIATKQTKEKIKQTFLENYGVEHPSQINKVKEKKKETCLKNYGVEHPMLSKTIKDKAFNSYIKNYIKEHEDILSITKNDIGEKIYTCLCDDSTCNLCEHRQYVISGSLYHSRNYQKITKCTIKNPIDEKTKDTSIELFVRNILDKYNVKYITNKRIINNLELDIYIPSKNIGIECNGIYWHSDKVKSKDYHNNKYNYYKNNNIQLLSIWEDWIKMKPKIVESIICSKLGIYENKLFARKCEIRNVSYNECKDFLNKNHIQGNSNSSVRLGLYQNDVLKSVMCFSKKRRSMIGNKIKDESEWELTRFCTELNTIIIGGASKLLKYFIKQYNPASIISFASHDISNGSLYNKLGFVCTSEFNSSYWYIDEKTLIRYHRYVFRKSELIKMGYDKNLSEFDIMNNLQYYRIFDSGQSKYVLKLLY